MCCYLILNMKFIFPYWCNSHTPKTNVGATGEAKAPVIQVTTQINTHNYPNPNVCICLFRPC